MSKGCLNKLIFAVISIFTGLTILLAIIYIGYEMTFTNLKGQLNSNNEELRARAEKVADFSRIPAGFEITRAIDLTGIKVVLASYPYSGQVMGIVDPGWALNINSKDITIEKLEEQIKVLVSNINKQDKVNINNFKVEKSDSFRAFDQTIPYIKVLFSVSGSHEQEIKGIIGMVKNPLTNKNLLVVSYNEPGKYRQITTERFFQSIELYKSAG